jgi:hypothetical protein
VSDEIPPELKQFIAQHVESLAQLEALLLMHREPQRDWDCAELARALYISEDMCQGIAAGLEQRRFATRTDAGAYRYAGNDPPIDALLVALAALYRDRRVAVITEIYSKPLTNVQTFADAFRLRRQE